MVKLFQRHLIAAYPATFQSKWISIGLAIVILGLPLSRALISLGVIWLSLAAFLPGNSLRNLPVWIWAGIILFSTYFFGLIYTEDLSKGLLDLWQKIPLVTVPIALWRAEKLPSRTIRGLLWLMVISCTTTILLMFGIAIWHSIQEGLSFDLIRTCAFAGDCDDPQLWNKARRWLTYSPLSGGIGQHPNWLSMILIGGFLSIVWLWDDARKRALPFSHWVMGFFTGLTFLAIALLSSRMQQLIFLTVVVAVGLYLLSDKTTWKMLILPASLMAVLFVGAMTVMPQSRERMKEILVQTEEAEQQKVEWTGVTVRKAIWQSGWELLGQIPIVGVGTGDYRDELTEQYQRDGFEYGYVRELDPHNQVLATVIALGIPGLMVLVFWISTQMITAFFQKKWAWMLWIMIFVFSGLSEVLLGRQVGIAYIAVIGAFLALHLPKTGIVPGGQTGSTPSK